MNKKAIWAIILLMSAAMIGIILLQIYWINDNIKLEEAQFDSTVQTAINKVSDRLAESETESIYAPSLSSGYSSNLRGGTLMNATFSKLGNGTGGRALPELERKEMKQSWLRLEQRIDIEMLEGLLNFEFENRGIETEYEYQVHSNQTGLIINNGNFVVTEENFSTPDMMANQTLHSSYSSILFHGDLDPGTLSVRFPNRTSLIWSSAWKTLLASIIFTGLIMFCFSYTVLVVFRQKQVSEMKTDFINNMTHEFKTPIATISLAADSIMSPVIAGNPDKVKRFADIIRQENKRMNNQVEKVLQMAVIDKREFNLKMAEINLHDVINQAVQNSSLQVEKKQGTVSTHLQAAQPYVKGDLTHVSNIVNNLLENANKYSPEKPEISVHTRNVKQGVEVIIRDKGIGMGKEARKHIFEKFYRVHTGNLHDVKGFGLGLSYVKAMMDAHKGMIDVKSELGKGSSFILTFPYNSNIDNSEN